MSDSASLLPVNLAMPTLKSPTLALALTLLAGGAAAAAEDRPTAEQLRFFESKVRPLLHNRCVRCHGPKKQEGSLRLDSAAALKAGGESGPAVVPGQPDKSRLIQAVRHDGLKMPPDRMLPAVDVTVLVDWVRQGAVWPGDSTALRKRGQITAEDRAYWAFRPVRDPAVPDVKDPSWARNAVDRFILAKLEAKQLAPVRTADRRALLRRVTLDLTGLPPTPEEVQAFVADKRVDAYERVVDRLLASPAYGERWGRHWLDVVRYADTAGDNSDYPVREAYLYRNWVIAALNDDRPYDLFLKEQIAGDLLPSKTPEEARERIIATGYLASSRRFGSYEDKRYQWYLTFEDTIENVGRTVLGLGLSCARCHDHKFDPIPTDDYYALYGFFQSTRYPWAGTELDKRPRDLVPIAAPEEIARAERERKEQLAGLDARIDKLPKGDKQIAKLKKERAALAVSPLPVANAYAVAEGQRWVGDARVQLSGDPTKPGKVVPRRFLSVLGGQPLPADVKGSGRLQLAGWLTAPSNPLTARVIVNRLWQYHFGRGLVPTPNDFGRQGQPPSHPELLDHLAARLVEGGWGLKAVHRLMLTSRTYQLASDDDERNAGVDPDNVLLWRANRRRLDAETIRDSLLSLSGLLDRSPGGAHPFPPVSTWNYTQHKPFKAVYHTDRRSVYLMTQRIARHPYLALFDGADTNASTARRTSSTTPLQALYLMNDPFVHRLAEAFGRRLTRERPDDAERIERSFLLAFGRPPGEEERTFATEYLAKARAKSSSGGEEAAEAKVWAGYARALFLTSELVYVD